MENFIYHIPTKIYFGQGKVGSLGEETIQYGHRALLVYGCGSIKKSGCYQEILLQCEKYQISLWELSGVKSNPDVRFVETGAQICKEHQIDCVLAAGGGSVLDCGKMIAAAAKTEDDPWELVIHPEKIKETLPVIAISTAAASGSEMDYTAVISNEEKGQKIACGCKLLLPKAAFLDPTYTMTLSQENTAEGIADILSHLMEIYFSDSRALLQERLNEAVFCTCIDCGRTLRHNPQDYNARANLMWAACWAMNGFLRWGKPGGWTCHIIAHEIGAAYPELPHGKILAVLLPKWLRKVVEKGKISQLEEWAVHVWGISQGSPRDLAESAIAALEDYFRELGLPEQLRIAITAQELQDLSSRICPQLQNCYIELTAEDLTEILSAI